MHHIHISTEFLLVAALLCIGLAWIVGWAVTTTRRDRREAERVWTAPEPFARRADYDTARRSTPPAGYSGGYVQPVAAAPVHNSGTDLLTGMLIGEAIAGHHSTTVIHDTSPVYVDNSPSYSSPDSGFSYSDSGSSDSGSSGGFDATW